MDANSKKELAKIKKEGRKKYQQNQPSETSKIIIKINPKRKT